MLKNALRLDSRVAIYVPGTVDVDKTDAGAAERMTARVARDLSDLFGGATITDGRGAWVSDVAGLVMENVRIVYSFSTADAITKHIDEIERIIETVKTEMRQEAVSVEIDGALYIA